MSLAQEQLDSVGEGTPEVSDTIMEMTTSELAIAYEKADIGLKEMISAKDVLSEEIISRMKGKEELAGDIILKRCVRTTPDVDIKLAEELGATKLAVDNDKIKALIKAGADIPMKEGKPYLLYSRVE